MDNKYLQGYEDLTQPIQDDDMREINKENSIKHLIEKIEEQERFLAEMGYDDDFSDICSWICDRLKEHLEGK